MGEYKQNGLTLVEVNDKYGYVDKTGKYVINLQYDDASNFANNGLAAVKSNGKVGFINTKGEYVINLQFDNAEDFNEANVARVKLGEKIGLIDNKGTYIVNPQYDNISDLSKEGYMIVMQNKKFGVINTKGNIIISVTNAGFMANDYSMEDSDYCIQDGCTNIKSYGSDYCSTHKPTTTYSSKYCKYPTCLNKVTYSWQNYCSKHSYLEYYDY